MRQFFFILALIVLIIFIYISRLSNGTSRRNNVVAPTEMELTKLILFSCLLSLSLCKRQHSELRGLLSSPHGSERQIPQESTLQSKYGLLRRINRITKNLRQCFCYLQKPTGVPVVQKLNPVGEKLQRIVVYLYKDPTSKDIKLYVPNNEKQVLIPDLLFDEGDYLETPTSETVHSLFNKFPYLVTEREHFDSPDVAQIIHPEVDTVESNIIMSVEKEQTPEHIKNTLIPGRVILEHVQHPDLNINLIPIPNKNMEIQTEQPSIHLIPVQINSQDENEIPNENLVGKIESDTINPNDQPIEVEETNMKPDEANSNINFYPVVLSPVTVEENIAPNVNSQPILEPQDLNVSQVETEQPISIDVTTPKPESTNIRPKIVVGEVYEPSKGANEQKPSIGRPYNRMVQPELVITNTIPTNNLADYGIHTPEVINDVVKPKEREEPKLISINLNTYEEPVSTVKNYVMRPDIAVEHRRQYPNEIENQNRPEVNKITGHHMVFPNTVPSYYNLDYNIPPHLVVNDNANPKGRPKLRPIAINVHRNYLDNIAPGNQLGVDPVKYLEKEVFRGNHLSPHDLSLIAVPQALVKNYQKVNGLDFHDTFDNWFHQQMKGVQFANSRASNSIDIYYLKYLIEKTLHDKGMHVTDKGYIIDSEGNVLRTANLGLRPILIGNSVEYKNLLQGKFSTFESPENMPYLEAVLITSIKPPRILGIVPLGKTYLPNRYQKPLPLYVEDEGTRSYGCSGACNMIVPSLRRKNDHYNHHQPMTTKESQRKAPSRRMFPFDQLNRFIDKIYRVPLPEDKVRHVVSRPNTYVVNYEANPLISTGTVVKYPIGVPAVTPGFRIIGGKPATSSGTPVSSKGRSGYDSLENSLDSEEKKD